MWLGWTICDKGEAVGKDTCVINLDETALLRASKPKGYIVKHKQHGRKMGLRRAVVKRLRRGMFTHVALISDDTVVQAKLPQLFLVNKLSCYRHPSRNAPRYAGLAEWECVEHRRQDVILDFPGKQAVLILDLAPCPLAAQVLASAHFHSIWLCYVPAKMTFLVQALDVCVLSAYRVALNQRLLLEESVGGVEMARFFAVLMDLVKTVWRGRRWKSAFERVGLLNRTTWHLTAELKHLAVDPIT